MERFVIDRTLAEIEALGDDGPAAVTEVLTGQGFAVGGVMMRQEPTPAIVVRCDADPTAVLAGWTPAPSAERRVLREALVVVRADMTAYDTFVAGAGPQPSLLDTQRALAAVIRLLAWRLRGAEP